MYDGLLGIHPDCVGEEYIDRLHPHFLLGTVVTKYCKKKRASWLGNYMLLQGVIYILALAFDLCDIQKVT